MIKKGTVYWITGLSGAGKTTIGKYLYHVLQRKKRNVLFLDGDILREVFGNDLGYSAEDRYKSAMRNSKLCKMLSDQGMDVVCCTISMFDDVRAWNRDKIERYVEIYLQVSMDILSKRNQKGLYTAESKRNLVGLDVKMEVPKCPDFVFENDGRQTPEQIVEQIL